MSEKDGIPYGIDWGPTTAFGVTFQVVYVFLSVGLFLLFVLEAGKTNEVR